MHIQSHLAHTLKHPVEAVVTACYPDKRDGSFSLSFTSELEGEQWADKFMKDNTVSCTIEYTYAELPF